MKGFELSENVDKNKVFLVNRSIIEKRLDPFYHIPDLLDLEDRIQEKQPLKLSKYVKSISSGATPKTSEVEKYYSDKENGIPFLRVQNLTTSSILNFDNVKYINYETHNGLLKRSQVKEGDLLVKITGVGRMAIASVAPIDFEGNINQHLVVIRTGNKEISEILAAYLNTDIAEKLASRRATGGTRPALDYPALLSIPIIFDKKILEIYKTATNLKQTKHQTAQNLLNSIDDYLLMELGITLPEAEDSLDSRIFTTRFREVSGGRFDTFYYQKSFIEFEHRLRNSNFNLTKLKDLGCKIDTGKGMYDYVENGIPYLNVNNIEKFTVNFRDCKKVSSTLLESENNIVNENTILTGRVGTVGKFALYTKKDISFISDNVLKLSVENENVSLKYLCIILNSELIQIQLKQNSKGSVQEVINKQTIKNLKIPLPPLAKQTEIANHISDLRRRAKQLQAEAEAAMQEAKAEVERMILGE